MPRKTASGRAYFTPPSRTSILASLSSPTPSRRKFAIVAVILLLILAAAAYYIFFRGPAKPAGPAPGPIPGIIELLPAEAPIIAYFDITAMRNSQLSAELSSLAGKPASDPDYAEFVRQTGFDYERDLDRAALAIWPGASRSTALAIAEGRFDREKITQYALRSGHVTKNQNIDILEVPVTAPTPDGRGKTTKMISFAFLSADRVVLADGASLDSVINHANANSSDAALRVRIERVAGAAVFVTARSNALPQDLSTLGIKSGQIERILRSIQFLNLAGRPAGAQLKVEAEAECDSVANALQLATVLDGLRWIGNAALADPKNRRQLQPQEVVLLDSLLRLVEVSREGKVVRLKVSLTPQMLGTPPKTAPQKLPSQP